MNRFDRQTKYIKEMGEVLVLLAKEVKQEGKFAHSDTYLLKKVGSSILYMGASLEFTEDNL